MVKWIGCVLSTDGGQIQVKIVELVHLTEKFLMNDVVAIWELMSIASVIFEWRLLSEVLSGRLYQAQELHTTVYGPSRYDTASGGFADS